MIKLDIGCGTRKKKGYIGIDKCAFKGVDIILDLEKDKLPFDDNSVDEVYSYHCFEHISNFDNVMEESHRVLKPNGILDIYVPYFSYPLVSSPFHKSYFNYYTFDFLEKKSDTMPVNFDFDVIEKKIIFKKYLGLGFILGFVFNKLPVLYEKTCLCYLLPARRLHFKLRRREGIP